MGKKSKMMKLLSFVMICIMTAAMMTGKVQAAGELTAPTGSTGFLTLKSTVEGEQTGFAYDIYKIFDSTPAGTNTFTYSWTKEFAGIDQNASYGSLTVEKIQNLKNGPENDGMGGQDTVDSITPHLEKYLTDQNIAPTKEDVPIDAKTELSYGYYLILETTTPADYKKSKPMLVEIPGAGGVTEVTRTVKNQKLVIEKKILEESILKDSIAEQVGKPITFQVTYDVPQYADVTGVVFKIVDTLGKGLTFDEKSAVKVYKEAVDEKNLLEQDTDYKFTFGLAGNQNGQTILTFDFSDLSADHGKNYYQNLKTKNVTRLIIQYQASLNEDAEFGPGKNDPTNVNKVIPIYGQDSNQTTEGPSDQTKSYSGAIEIKKKDAEDDKKLLPGAEFTVYEADEKGEITDRIAQLVTYQTVDGQFVPNKIGDAKATTGTDGTVRFGGFGEGTYYIKETASPDGYLLLKEPIKVVVQVQLPTEIANGNEEATFTYKVSGGGVENATATDGDGDGFIEFEINNKKGISLPTTGGMGTYLFTVGGALLIGAAVILRLRPRQKS